MHLILVSVGVALIVFGAVVLLRFSDRPGGSVKLLKIEVSSAGAGLPLICIGVGCILFTVLNPAGSPGDTTTEVGSVTSSRNGSPATGGPVSADCFAPAIASVPSNRVKTIELGMNVQILEPHYVMTEPFGLVLTENGQPIGALRLQAYKGGNSSEDIFKIEEVIDAACKSVVESASNDSRGGEPRTLTNWDTVRMRLGDHEYTMRIGGENEVTVSEFRRVPEL